MKGLVVLVVLLFLLRIWHRWWQMRPLKEPPMRLSRLFWRWAWWSQPRALGSPGDDLGRSLGLQADEGGWHGVLQGLQVRIDQPTPGRYEISMTDPRLPTWLEIRAAQQPGRMSGRFLTRDVFFDGGFVTLGPPVGCMSLLDDHARASLALLPGIVLRKQKLLLPVQSERVSVVERSVRRLLALAEAMAAQVPYLERLLRTARTDRMVAIRQHALELLVLHAPDSDACLRAIWHGMQDRDRRVAAFAARYAGAAGLTILRGFVVDGSGSDEERLAALLVLQNTDPDRYPEVLGQILAGPTFAPARNAGAGPSPKLAQSCAEQLLAWPQRLRSLLVAPLPTGSALGICQTLAQTQDPAWEAPLLSLGEATPAEESRVAVIKSLAILGTAQALPTLNLWAQDLTLARWARPAIAQIRERCGGGQGQLSFAQGGGELALTDSGGLALVPDNKFEEQ